MVWGKRRLAGLDYMPAMDLLGSLLMANPALYLEFMMVSTKTSKPLVSDYYIGVPSKAHLALFEGFDSVGEIDVPNVIDSLQIADANAFKSRFEFAHNVRRSKSA